MKLLDLNHPTYLRRLAQELRAVGTRPMMNILTPTVHDTRGIADAKYSRGELLIRFVGESKWTIATMKMRNTFVDGYTGREIVASREMR